MAEDRERRSSEFVALSAIFDEVVGDEADGPWQIPLHIGGAVLEVHLPPDYPSKSPPTPVLFAPAISDEKVTVIAQGLLDMFDEDAECVFTWVAHVRELLEEAESEQEATAAAAAAAAAATAAEAEELELAAAAAAFEMEPDGGYTYVPPTSKYGQRVRHFGAEVSDDRFKVAVVSGEPFHPPKSGPGETFQAHVASVTSMGQVNWVLAFLLRDKKIARATHNMIAYSFVDAGRGVKISDNDDDGEGGSGAKLASTIENTGAQNVLVVVSRWFGGVHLGPARFKYIASVAGALLDEQGFCRRGQGNGPGKRK